MGYFKPNSKTAIKLAIAVKSFTGVISLAEFFTGNKTAAFIIFLIGAAANEAINFLSDGTKENPKVSETSPEL